MDQILLIDDDDTILKGVSKMLGHLGYEVKVARDGEEGIALFKNCSPLKAVITDIRMPKKDGNQVAKYIRDSDKIGEIPIVAITGFVDDVEREFFDVILEKPFKVKDLIPVIDSCR
jgi:chemosensory pili system protein ChpA (sensor histidine kinase/response regulator)